jgi:hypothetical protein
MSEIHAAEFVLTDALRGLTLSTGLISVDLRLNGCR